jgi:hypothetical protein
MVHNPLLYFARRLFNLILTFTELSQIFVVGPDYQVVILVQNIGSGKP